MKRITAIVAALVLVLSFSGCGQEVSESVQSKVDAVPAAETAEMTEKAEEETEQAVEEIVTRYPMALTDKFGSEVIIEKAPESIISMSPELTEIIFALDAGGLMIGRSSFCDYPAEASEVQDYGSLFDLNVESIVAAQPDVIFLSSMASEELVTTLRNQSLTVMTFDKDSSLEGTYGYMATVGAIIDKEVEAAALAEDVKTQIASVVEKVAGLEAPTVYYVVYAGDGYDSTATGDTFLNDILITAGGDNIAKDGTDWSYSVETLVEQNPEMIFCSGKDGSKTKIQGLEGYKDLTAVKEDHLYEVDPDIFSRQGPRIGDAVETIAGLMHPDVFK